MLFLQNILEDGLFAAMAAIGFSSISNTPRRTYIFCALAAAAGHAVRFVLMSEYVGMNIILASTLAAFVVGLLSVLLAPVMKCPAEVCLFPALLPMIPGMYAYHTIEALILCLGNTGEQLFSHYMYLLAYNGLTCAFIVLGLAIGATIPIFMLKKISFQATR
ncbi:MAG: threonine/serine exporter [Bacteroidales bacterium]|nr:threonine/serine exporter [Bacteroidales bacterium]